MVEALAGKVPHFSSWVHDPKYLECKNIQDVATMWNESMAKRKLTYKSLWDDWTPKTTDIPFVTLKNFMNTHPIDGMKQ